MAETLNFGPEWLHNLPNSTSTAGMTTVTTPTITNKIPLAEYRYGREEMLLFYSDSPPFPHNMANIPTLVRTQPVSPIAMFPLSPEEQMVLSGSVNSGAPYSGRGKGGYFARGGRGRGRGGGPGRPDYYRTSSSNEDRGYYRSNSDSHWTDEGRGGGYSDRGGRAVQDTNWRSQKDGPWNKPWHPSGPLSPVKPQGSWTEKKDRWQPLPEWATDDNASATSNNSGVFDNKGNYSVTDKPPDESSTTKDDDIKNEETDTLEDVFLDEPENDNKETRPPSPPKVASHSKEEGTSSREPIVSHHPKNGRIASADSMEEMERRFEKAAEAVLSTEDEDTPSPSPNPTHSSISSHQESLSLQLKPPVAPVADETNRWFYQDPQGETQGPFSNHEMNDWFLAGYFTMDLHVRRVCDAIMLPLGQVIRIWKRVPFSTGPHPPPLQPTEPFWQQLFQQQHQLFPQSHGLPTTSTAYSTTNSVPKHHTPSHQQNEPSPIWGIVPAEATDKEDQWPDLSNKGTGHGVDANNSIQQILAAQRQEEERKRQAEEKQIEEERKRQAEEEERHKVAEIQKQFEEDRRKRFEEEQQQRLREEEERQRRDEEKRRLEAIERLRLEEERREQERKRREEDSRRKEEERKQLEENEREREQLERERREKEETALLKLQRQQELEERQRKEDIRMQQDILAKGWTQEIPSPIRPHTLPTGTAPSLIQIQQQEAKEMVRQQKLQTMMLAQHQQQQLQTKTASLGWSSATTPTSNFQTTPSFLEIQQEQQQQVTGRGGGNNSGTSSGKASSKKSVIPSATSPSSWSKIAAGTNNRQSQNPPWGVNHAPVVSRPSPNLQTMPSSVSTPPKEMSFWEECALENTRTGGGRGRGREREGGGASKTTAVRTTREEEKIRQLFTSSTSDEAFTQWCAGELAKYNTDVDAATFVNLLLEVESTYEVHDYIKSFLGETDEIHAFAKQFLERRQKIRSYGCQQKKPSGASSDSSLVTSSSSRNSKKKKKAKMQKMTTPAAFLGFTVNAAERPNAGEIHSAKDAM